MAGPGDPDPVPCEVIPSCGICGGRMELVYDRPHTKVCVCVDCHSSMTVPVAAWGVARIKRDADLKTLRVERRKRP